MSTIMYQIHTARSNAERRISFTVSFRLSVRASHAGIVSK